MSDLFDELSTGLLGREGGYVNNPDDRGGETIWGITVGTARANGYSYRMQDMTKEQALEIYRRVYWEDPNFSHIGTIDSRIAAELFDTGVNMGPKTAATFLQRALNVLNNKGADYPDIAPDGVVGNATLQALIAFLTKRGQQGSTVMLRALNCLQGARYIELAESRQANETFEFGWLAQRVGIQ